MASYYRNYYDHQTEYDDEQSVADSQTDLYGYNNNKFRPQRQSGPSVFDRPSRQARTNNRGPLNHRRSSFMSQDFYYLPENEQGNSFNYTYQQPRHSRPHSSHMNIDPIVSPDKYQHYYQDQQQQHGRRQGSQGNKQYQDYPITPEDERNNFLYHDQSLASSSEEVANYSATLMNNNNGLYMVPESQHSGVTLDEDDNSFIEDTTTQRNTLINSESSAPVADAYYQNQPLSPQVGDQVSPLQLTSPFEPPLTQQLQQSEDIVDQSNPAVVGMNSPVEKKKWFKSILSTALIIKKKAQKLKRDDVSKSNLLRQQQQQQHAMYGNTVSPLIQVISAGNNELVGDVLDSRQQQELITQLYQSPPPAPGSNANLLPEKTKITSLDRIWVFRLIEEDTTTAPTHSSIAWIGFDFENQLKIEQHIKELETRPEDGRLALYDSHIRHKSMPVIVTPNDNKGYYFADIHQNKLITLEITFIENDHQKVTFVYRV
ncbi:hypothetical protein PS15m_002605 [Mucor circinelloides]